MSGLGTRKLKDRFHKGKLLPYRVYYNTARQRYIFFVYNKTEGVTKKLKSFATYESAVAYAAQWEFINTGTISTRNKYIAEKYDVNIFIQTDLFTP